MIRRNSRSRSSISSRGERLDPLGAEVLDVERGEHRPVGHRLAEDAGVEDRVAGGAPAVEVAEEAARRSSRPPRWGRARPRADSPGSRRSSSPEKSAAPYSPRLATITSGPISIAARAARARFGSPVSSRISASFSIRQSTSAIAATSDSRALSSQKFIESRAANSRLAGRPGRCCWSSGSMFPRKRSSDCFEAVRELRVEVGEDVELGVVGVGDVHVVLVVGPPEEGLAALDPLDVVGDHAAVLEHLELLVAEVIADRPDHSDVGEEARGQAEVDG